MRTKKRILILSPLPQRTGGVTNYYCAISKCFTSSIHDIQFYYTGKKSDMPSIISRAAYSLKDLICLFFKFPRYDLIHFNPSLDPKSVIRDGLYHFIAKCIFKKKTIIFIRGWSSILEKLINMYFSRLFKIIFNCDRILVLADSFKDTLIKWGFKSEIIRLETTTVDDSLLNEFHIDSRIDRIGSRKEIQLLFLARIEKEKGILETIETFSNLNKQYSNIRLAIAGKGSFINVVHNYVKKLAIKNLSFYGYVQGKDKKSLFLNSDIFVFPTFHPEGMPNSVLEAMALGLPVVTRPVGALKDFFKNGEYGYMIESKNPSDIAVYISKIIDNKKLWKLMAYAAHKFAVQRFISSKVAARIENIYRDVLQI